MLITKRLGTTIVSSIQTITSYDFCGEEHESSSCQSGNFSFEQQTKQESKAEQPLLQLQSRMDESPKSLMGKHHEAKLSAAITTQQQR